MLVNGVMDTFPNTRRGIQWRHVSKKPHSAQLRGQHRLLTVFPLSLAASRQEEAEGTIAIG
ncbi:hypothetical protein AtDm6_1999 [Acetobacter tropicalis]|uniref:Uncharacterized protein n=1 Tax=Acetobacter tropicalis TaxID=104102 RepID=A0A094YQ97_9PROT|nr:hypothetical protein AtDm6_1999 [Acetobacter tropicalis]